MNTDNTISNNVTSEYGKLVPCLKHLTPVMEIVISKTN